MKDIFRKEESLAEDDYPDLIKYAHAIHESFWTPEHFKYDRDVSDFNIVLNDNEKQVMQRLMLAIANVENKVKTMWARLDMRIPKGTIADVAHTFAGNECIHKMTYAKLLDLLGLRESFKTLGEVPCMEGRAKYLTKYLEGLSSRSNKEFTKSLILFISLIENSSLFSQFACIASFSRYKNIMSNFNTVVSATGREEQLHGQFGAELIKIIRTENPEWFDEEMEAKIRRNIRKAYKAECEVLDWVFEGGELDFLSKEELVEYLKYRFNVSLKQLGYEAEYEINEEKLSKLEFFERQTKCSISFDFFDSKSSEYSETNMITEDDWN